MPPRPRAWPRSNAAVDLLRRETHNQTKRRDESRGNQPVKIFIVACIAAAVIALGAVVVLNSIQEPVTVAYSTTGVRL
jgi:hypothetical protein